MRGQGREEEGGWHVRVNHSACLPGRCVALPLAARPISPASSSRPHRAALSRRCRGQCSHPHPPVLSPPTPPGALTRTLLRRRCRGQRAGARRGLCGRRQQAGGGHRQAVRGRGDPQVRLLGVGALELRGGGCRAEGPPGPRGWLQSSREQLASPPTPLSSEGQGEGPERRGPTHELPPPAWSMLGSSAHQLPPAWARDARGSGTGRSCAACRPVGCAGVRQGCRRHACSVDNWARQQL